MECLDCINKTHKVYWGELSEKDMELLGYTYHKCLFCSHQPLIWNTLIGDAVCEGCGEWQDVSGIE